MYLKEILYVWAKDRLRVFETLIGLKIPVVYVISNKGDKDGLR